jgi:hypothetical protein
MLPEKFDCLQSVYTLGHDFHIVNTVDERDKSLPHDRLIVNYHDTDFVVFHLLGQSKARSFRLPAPLLSGVQSDSSTKWTGPQPKQPN